MNQNKGKKKGGWGQWRQVVKEGFSKVTFEQRSKGQGVSSVNKIEKRFRTNSRAESQEAGTCPAWSENPGRPVWLKESDLKEESREMSEQSKGRERVGSRF